MSLDQLKSACVRLAIQEVSSATVSPPALTVLSEVRLEDHKASYPPEYGHAVTVPVPIPGGDHFVILSRNRRKLILYSSLDPNVRKTILLKSHFSISQWTMTAVSADEVMVLTASVSNHGLSQ
jgi:hypothetical protein